MKQKASKRIFKNKISKKYCQIDKVYQLKLKEAKKLFKRKTIDDIKQSNKLQLYSMLKWISSFDQHKSEEIQVDEISHPSDIHQGEAIADSPSNISNQYRSLRTEDIILKPIQEGSYPQFTLVEVRRFLENIKTKKSTVLGDIPARIVKDCANYLCIPIRDFINKSILTGKWATIYKRR